MLPLRYVILIVIVCISYLVILNRALQLTTHARMQTVVEGTVTTDPELQGTRYVFQVNNVWVETSKKTTVERGDSVYVAGTRKEEVIPNPYAHYWLISKEVVVRQRFKDLPYLHQLYSQPITLIQREFRGVREQLVSRLTMLFPQHSAQLIAGMVLGAKQSFPQELTNTLRNSGLIHLVVASGSNVVLLVSLIVATTEKYLTRLQKISVVYVVIVGYLFLAGLEPPLIRASLMVGTLWIAQMLGRKTHGIWVLGITALAMLLVDPLLLFSLSFQLSVMATAGIILFSYPLRLAFDRVMRKTGGAFFSNCIGSDFAQSVAAQLMVVPLILYAFGQTNALAVIANIVVAPVIVPIIIGSLFTLMLSYCYMPLAQIVAWLLTSLADYILVVATLFGDLSILQVTVELHWYMVLGLWGLLLVIWWWYRKVNVSSSIIP